MQGDRAKAYRPLPEERRREAYEAGLAAYRAGDFFAAHELLEPAWMGTADLGERALYQGIIKLAAAFVHGVRGNPTGVARNLVGSRAHLARAAALGADGGLDLRRLLADIDTCLEAVAALPPRAPRRPGTPRFAPAEPVPLAAPRLRAAHEGAASGRARSS